MRSTLLSIVMACATCAAYAQSPGDRVPDLPATPYNYSSPSLPLHYLTAPPPPPPPAPAPISVVGTDNTPLDNPITDKGATLGRVLFYDTNLSLNRTVACASCHRQVHGFSDPLALSLGFDGGLTGRHSMSLGNARFFARESAFWDERAASLEEQALKPIQDSVEMGLTLTELETRVNALPYYDALFVDTFGDSVATSDRISKALAQFVRSLVTYQSKYDAGRAMVANPGLPFPNFTAQENLGKQVFAQSACIVCHGTDAHIDTSPRAQNNGLDLNTSADEGVFLTTGDNLDRGAFKVPSLRNIAVTAPYMHDGRFATLAEVVEFYDSGIQAHPNLSPVLRDGVGNPLRLNLTEQEKDALVAFLETLTDPTFLADAKFSDPFVFPPATPSPTPYPTIIATMTVTPALTPDATVTSTPGAGCCTGDADQSGSYVNGFDISAVRGVFGNAVHAGDYGSARCEDGFVNGFDLTEVRKKFGAVCP